MDIAAQIQSKLEKIRAEAIAAATGKTASIEQSLKEMNERQAEVEQIVAGAKFLNRSGARSADRESIGRRAVAGFTDGHAAFDALAQRNQGTARLTLESSLRAALVNEDYSSTDDVGTTFPSQPTRRGIVGEVHQPHRLISRLPHTPTESDASEHVVQNSTAGSAGEQTAEGDEKAELSLDFEVKETKIATIAAWTAASSQALADHARLGPIIDRTLRTKTLTRLETQLLNGGSRIVGLRQVAASFVPTIATTPADAIGEAIAVHADMGYSPSLIVMNSMDWFRLSTTKTETEGEYLFGSPLSPMAPTLWSLPVVTPVAMPAGEVLVIDTAFTTVLDRQAPSVLISNSHADFFTRNLVAILVELRAGLEVTDSGAVLSLNINAST